jgi:hypothetical protein
MAHYEALSLKFFNGYYYVLFKVINYLNLEE